MQGLCWFPPGSTASRDMLIRWTIAFARASKAHLRTDCDLDAELKVCGCPLHWPPTGCWQAAAGLPWSCATVISLCSGCLLAVG